ncbi:MAG: hypothetical protein HZY75_14355 [Nocardioidaceae bacterium]|nr:MAG: hypothetical protein HZY75_14355 [Nocardioidaceae bacterium]
MEILAIIAAAALVFGCFLLLWWADARRADEQSQDPERFDQDGDGRPIRSHFQHWGKSQPH